MIPSNIFQYYCKKRMHTYQLKHCNCEIGYQIVYKFFQDCAFGVSGCNKQITLAFGWLEKLTFFIEV